MSIRFYCGINEKVWNYYPVSPGKYACVSPVMGAATRKIKVNPVFVPEGVEVIQDSGAFCDSLATRLSFEGALNRQILHAKRFNYSHLITHRASYDLLVDEKWNDQGERSKIRWEADEAEYAVDETIKAADYLSKHRLGLGLVLSAQGVTRNQYMRCAEEVVPMMDLDKDIFGFGGWCIIGRKKASLFKDFVEIVSDVVPYLSENGVKKIHIWGVLYSKPLGALLWICDKYNIELSTDSSGPQKRPVFGQWGFADWKDATYQRPPTSTRGQERARHVQAVISWLDDFRSTQYYVPPETLLRSIR
jgi:hypothetical protein